MAVMKSYVYPAPGLGRPGSLVKVSSSMSESNLKISTPAPTRETSPNFARYRYYFTVGPGITSKHLRGVATYMYQCRTSAVERNQPSLVQVMKIPFDLVPSPHAGELVGARGAKQRNGIRANSKVRCAPERSQERNLRHGKIIGIESGSSDVFRLPVCLDSEVASGNGELRFRGSPLEPRTTARLEHFRRSTEPLISRYVSAVKYIVDSKASDEMDWFILGSPCVNPTLAGGEERGTRGNEEEKNRNYLRMIRRCTVIGFSPSSRANEGPSAVTECDKECVGAWDQDQGVIRTIHSGRLACAR
ncbi:hypothetical protein DFS33DRAFT_1276470 [Desarmillaria ectypa]|nr:hypothetical protein DFS33DRAFT_1276470 [Desarmillaria ectypa]